MAIQMSLGAYTETPNFMWEHLEATAKQLASTWAPKITIAYGLQQSCSHMSHRVSLVARIHTDDFGLDSLKLLWPLGIEEGMRRRQQSRKVEES